MSFGSGFLRHVPLVFAVLLAAAACEDDTPSLGCDANPLGPGCVAAPLTGQANLAVAPTIQQTQVWCWAAAAEMVFRYYGLPSVNPAGNYQCGIVAAWFGTQGFPACLNNCALCQYPVGAMSNEWRVITEYGPFIRLNGGSSRVLTAVLLTRALTAQEIKTELDAGRPIVIGIAPGGGFALPNASQHIAVMVGYQFDATQQSVIINDPFPFDVMPFSQYPHPYLAAGASRVTPGRYSVPLASMSQLLWANSIYRIQVAPF